jgi:hypothetical protein
MAAIYMWPLEYKIILTTTPYPVEVVESLVFGATVTSGRMDEIASAEASGSFSPGADGTLVQLRWFYVDGPYDNEVSGTFGVGPDGTLVQLRWFYTDGPYDDEVSGTFAAFDGTLIQKTKLVIADTPDELLQVRCVINDTCTMDLI